MIIIIRYLLFSLLPLPCPRFTPKREVPLCGHATMASAAVLVEFAARAAAIVEVSAARRLTAGEIIARIDALMRELEAWRRQLEPAATPAPAPHGLTASLFGAAGTGGSGANGGTAGGNTSVTFDNITATGAGGGGGGYNNSTGGTGGTGVFATPGGAGQGVTGDTGGG